MKINFYPDSDSQELIEASREYQNVWNQEGERITQEIEKVSGLKFKKEFLNAIVWWEKYDYAYPLSFSYSASPENKKFGIVHELCHRLMMEHEIEPAEFTVENTHKQIFLILYDIWVNLYGEEAARDYPQVEISIWDQEGDNPYELAWNYALSMTKEQRAIEFKKNIPPK